MKLKKYQFKKTKSTNDIAIKKIKSGMRNGVVLADIQSRGRGKYGKKWISFEGNLHMSIFFELKNNISLSKVTSKNCGIVKQALQKYTKYKIKIKPPNDLLINKHKICGILQEMLFFDKKKFLIVGIGLNLIKSPKIKNYPTDYLNNYTSKKISKLIAFKSIKDLYKNKIFKIE